MVQEQEWCVLVTLIVEMSEHNKATSDNARRVEAAAAGAIWVSVFCCLVWPCMLYEFVEAKDGWALLWEREQQMDFVPNGVVTGTVG